MFVMQRLRLRPFFGCIKFALICSGQGFFDHVRGKFSLIMFGQVFFDKCWAQLSLIIVGQVFFDNFWCEVAVLFFEGMCEKQCRVSLNHCPLQ